MVGVGSLIPAVDIFNMWEKVGRRPSWQKLGVGEMLL